MRNQNLIRAQREKALEYLNAFAKSEIGKEAVFHERTHPKNAIQLPVLKME